MDRLPKDVAGLVSAVFFVAAGLAFLYTARAAWRGGLTVRRVVLVGVALHVLALFLPLFLSRDVYSYTMYGRMVSVYGTNPYVSAPIGFAHDPVFPYLSPDWNTTRSVYGPGFLAIAGGITGVADSPSDAVWAFKLLAVAASAATMLLVVMAARRARPERAAFGAVLIGWNPVVVLHGAAGGHSDALVGLAVAGAVVLLLSQKDLWATAALALGTLVKVSGGVPLLVAVIAAVARRPRGQRLRAAAMHLGISAAVAAPFVIPFLQTRDPTLGVFNLTKLQGWLAPSRLLAVSLRALGRFLGSPMAGEVLWIVVRVAFPAVFLVALVAVARHLAREPHRVDALVIAGAMAWMSILGLMSSPLLLPWYVVWFLPMAWLLPRSARAAAVVMSAALGATELVAEPSSAPRVWEAMVLGIHYVATPLVLALFIWLLRDLLARLALSPASEFLHPLLVEEVSVPAGASRGEVPQASQDDRRSGAPASAVGKADPVGDERSEHGDGKAR
jgi:alpha-1,6-mannosyltransferase